MEMWQRLKCRAGDSTAVHNTATSPTTTTTTATTDRSCIGAVRISIGCVCAIRVTVIAGQRDADETKLADAV